ncbi:MAG: sulfatase-like hydrolase/transferase [Acidobacteria bacterium]|nr:sulfatase-like hydrolase/transferase [Acidobacteriota bacterium]
MRSPSRSRLLALALLALVLLPGCGKAPSEPERSEPARKPNIVVFITDDESWLERSAYGWSHLPTPNFDRVAREGALFTHAYSSAPSCAPARASLLTGHNFWELEQGSFIQAWLPTKFPVVPDLLAAAGYRVGHTGKGWGPGVYPEGGHGPDSAGKPYQDIRLGDPQEAISAVDYTANFEAFLDQTPAEEPFFFWVGLTEPHAPWAQDNYEKLQQRYGVSLDQVSVPGFLPDTPAIRRQRANMLYEVCYADEQLGKVLKMLEERGQLDNTLLIVTGDNGTSFPRSKASLYDWGVHVPLAIRWPSRAPAGRTIEDFVTFGDLGVTALAAGGAPVPPEMTGRSLVATLESDKSGLVDPTRDWVVTGLEWHGEFDPVNLSGRMIRDQRYEYIVRYGSTPALKLDPALRRPDSEYAKLAETANTQTLLQSFPGRPELAPLAAAYAGGAAAEELFDLEKDPWQLHNVADDPAYAEIKTRLQETLRAYQLETGDPRATGSMEIFDQTRQFVQERKHNGYPR